MKSFLNGFVVCGVFDCACSDAESCPTEAIWHAGQSKCNSAGGGGGCGGGGGGVDVNNLATTI
jgi:hypothetical protein